MVFHQEDLLFSNITGLIKVAYVPVVFNTVSYGAGAKYEVESSI